MTRAAAAAGLAASALLPGARLGVGVPIVALLVALAVARAARPAPRLVLLGALAVALASLAAVRDAGWVVTLDLTAAWLLATVAAGGLDVSAPAAPLVRLVQDRAAWAVAPAEAAPAARGLVLGVAVAAPFAALFLAGDAAFAELASRIPAPTAASVTGRATAFGLVALAAVGLALAARRPTAVPLRRPAWGLRPVDWGVALCLLDLLFVAFVAVQLTVFFGGRDHVLETTGLTYAEYARQGFWQLLAAAALTLAVLGTAAVLAQTPSRRDTALLRAGLAVLSALTLVVLASALRRLDLYEEAFGLTRLRLVAEAGALWIAGLVVLATVAALVARARRAAALAAVVGTAAGLFVFSVANPDGHIAERNVERYRETGSLDVAYLAGLSADAAPALARLPKPLAGRTLRPIRARLSGGDPWFSANLARERARDVFP